MAYTVADPAWSHQVVLSIERSAPARTVTPRHTALFHRLGPLGSSMFYVFDLKTQKTRYMDRELAALLGLSALETRIEEVRERLHPDDLPLLTGHLGDMAQLEEGEVTEVTLRLRDHEGRWRWIQSRARPLTRDRFGAVRRVIGAAADLTERQELTEALAEASRALAQAEEKERRRVGRELHDSTAQHLVAIDLALASVERRGGFAEAHQGALGDIRTSLATAQREIRAFSYLLHPPRLDEEGLVATLTSFCEGFGRRTEVTVLLKTAAYRPQPPATEMALFRVVQEALMNVYRHAKARAASVSLAVTPRDLLLEVEDDGVGLPSAVSEAHGVGLSGMRARVAQLGGTMVLQNGEQGLRVRVRIPRTGR